MSDTLARCPFCGSTNVFEGAFFVICGKCDAYGPSKDTEAEATAAWNHRPIETVLRGELEDARKELEQLRNDLDGQCINLKTRNERDQARAELAEMKARTCETCLHTRECTKVVMGRSHVWYFMKSCSCWARKEQP